MGAACVTRIVLQREDMDCCVASLAMYLGETYENVLRAVSVTEKRYQGRRGLWTKTMRRVGTTLGHALRTRKTIDWDGDYGVLLMPDHAAVLRNGLVIDGDGTVWDADTYLANRSYERDECELMVCEE